MPSLPLPEPELSAALPASAATSGGSWMPSSEAQPAANISAMTNHPAFVLLRPTVPPAQANILPHRPKGVPQS